MDEGQVELFRRSREFLAERGMARNVRIQDVVAITAVLDTVINANQSVQSAYGTEGGFPGPLNSEGNMPTSTMGVIIGSAVLMPRLNINPGEIDTWQQLTQNAHHVVSVASTNVIAKHVTYSAAFSSLSQAVAVGPLFGTPDSNRRLYREPEPTLVVGPGERVQQSLFFRRESTFGGATGDLAAELALLMVIADEGSD